MRKREFFSAQRSRSLWCLVKARSGWRPFWIFDRELSPGRWCDGCSGGTFQGDGRAGAGKVLALYRLQTWPIPAILTLHICSCCTWHEASGAPLLVLLNSSTFVVPLINLTDHCQAQSQTQRFSQQQSTRGGKESRQLFSFPCFLCSHCMLMCKLVCTEHTALVEVPMEWKSNKCSLLTFPKSLQVAQRLHSCFGMTKWFQDDLRKILDYDLGI